MASNSKKLEIATTKSGYFDCWEMVQNNIDDFNFFIIIGGRRLGKTYSILKGLITEKKQHMYVRRTDADLEECLTVKKNPYRVLNKDLDLDIRLYAKGKEMNIVEFEDDNPNEYLGIASSVSKSGSVRGAYLEDIEYLIYDEFINLKPVNTLRKKEGNLFLDLYDTANNDRDIRGSRALKAILLSNANTVDDGIIRTLKLGSVIYQMIINNQNYYADYDRKIYVALLPSDNVITNKRRTSAIGLLTQGTTYADMAMSNEFQNSYFGDIDERVRYNEYIPAFAINNLYFYRHKGDGHLFVSKRKAKCVHYSNNTIRQFKRDYGMIFGSQYESGRMRYQNYDVKLDVINLL